MIVLSQYANQWNSKITVFYVCRALAHYLTYISHVALTDSYYVAVTPSLPQLN